MKRTLLTLFIASSILAALYYFNAFSNEKTFNMAAIKEQIRKNFPNVNQLSTQDFKKILDQVNDKKITLLDVRETKEYKTSHIKTAELSSGIEDALLLLQNKPKDTLIVAYCSVGYRSSELAQQLNEHGYTNVYNLEGSIFEWANAGFPVYLNGEKVNKVHPYNKKWGKLLNQSLHP